MSSIHPIVEIIASNVRTPINKVNSVLNLSSDGSTVAFIARYRKEQTGGLDEVKIRDILLERDKIFEILDRQQTIIKAINEQNKLTQDLKNKILKTFDKFQLEDIYAPYKKKRKTKADIAKDLGLEPFSDNILKQRLEEGDPLKIAEKYLNPIKKLTDANLILEHAVNIISEKIANDVDLKKQLRNLIFKNGSVYSKKSIKFKEEKSKFENYFKYNEKITNFMNPKNSHRVLAIKRGFAEKILSIGVNYNESDCINIINEKYITNPKTIFIKYINTAIEKALKDYMFPSIQVDIFNELKTYADKVAINVFARNVKDLLMQAPLGEKTVMGIDPGFRTGSKIAIVDKNGNFLDKATIYCNEPHKKIDEAKEILKSLIEKYKIEAVSIGNGTASRETDKFVTDLLEEIGKKDEVINVIVNEAGASIYSASDISRQELSGLDITFRGSVSIARRLQDPLAELVKIDPKSIGVGQYQHDVDQKELKNKLIAVIEDCVNYVGVNLNVASPSLLSYVSGLGDSLAKNICKHRLENGAFKTRNELINVTGLGEKAFEQASGFLRIRDCLNILDNTGVHPEKYEIVENLCKENDLSIKDLINDKNKIREIFTSDKVKEQLGEYTANDILKELELPGRDPRKEFKKVNFSEDIKEIKNLKIGMILNGVVTNITNFGVFVDIGVHEDGLVHISELTNKNFVKDPRDVVSLSEQIKVKVISIDIDKKQIGLSIKQTIAKPKPSPKPKQFKKDYRNKDKKFNKSRNKNFDRKPRVNPNSPFAVLADLKNKIDKK
jgi:protein Tex